MSSDDRKYQVFVSSTFQDLQAERQAVIQALLELDCIPSGMELFPAADEDQWSLIKGIINDCDYYIVVIAGRYGSIGPEGLSYTEMEYRYAVELGKPVLAFVHSNPGSISITNSETDSDRMQKLADFRELVRRKMVKGWASAHELGSVVSRSLVSLKRTHPGIGWVRGDKVASADATAEILRLRQRIDELQAQLQKITTEAPAQTSGLAQDDEEFEFTVSFNSTISEPSFQQFQWTHSLSWSWNDLFFALSPLLLGDVTAGSLYRRLNHEAARDIAMLFGENAQDGFQGHEFDEDSLEVDKSDFETIQVQFLALGYIAKSARARGVKDPLDYWTLTPYGQTVMNRLRAISSKKANQHL
jgi:hypothetical protein